MRPHRMTPSILNPLRSLYAYDGGAADPHFRRGFRARLAGARRVRESPFPLVHRVRRLEPFPERLHAAVPAGIHPEKAGRTHRRNGVRFTIGILFLLGLAGCDGSPGAPKAQAPAEAQLAAAVVEKRDVEIAYTAEAVVEAVRQSTVAAQIAGRIVELRFDVGDYVKKGEVIVRIDERAAAQAVAASEAQVRQAQAALRNARAEYERSRQDRKSV